MTNDEARKNDEIRMTKNVDMLLRHFRHSSFFRHLSFGLRHCFLLRIERCSIQRILRARMPAITLATCVGLSDTLGALKQRPFYWMDCVVLNIGATTQPVSLL